MWKLFGSSMKRRGGGFTENGLVFTGKVHAPKQFPSGAEVVAAVAADPTLIGYVDSSFVNMTVKVICTVK